MRLFLWYFRWFLPASIIKTEILKGKKASKFGAIAIGPTQTFAPKVLAFYPNKSYQVFSEKNSTYDILIVHVLHFMSESTSVGGHPFFFHNLLFLFFFLKVKIKRTSGFDFLKCFRIKLAVFPNFSELKILLFWPSQ